MKTLSLLAAAALGLSGAIASAQTQGTTTAPADTTTAPMPSASQTAPAATSSATPSGTEPTVDLRSEPSPPADRRAAREEAVNALAWAKSEGCRSDPSPRDCVRQAQEEYRATMAQLGERSGARSSGTTSASGTAAATGSEGRAPRADRH